MSQSVYGKREHISCNLSSALIFHTSLCFSKNTHSSNLMMTKRFSISLSAELLRLTHSWSRIQFCGGVCDFEVRSF